ncbi:hypothetical protein PQU92_05220 [Asticcacaulis sp. BYS171W]|uniref:Uncharacterized protein n=1 Tax=Asticcacaulis aquaticus TaxID=2984212 RepID=A0ABT5HRG8_9CAUL|nr:hypothetical protein [Asticcacaulis aquaticus]MDC7682665.1 hypothetical protein [Asticcacaulis aquaticus]
MKLKRFKGAAKIYGTIHWFVTRTFIILWLGFCVIATGIHVYRYLQAGDIPHALGMAAAGLSFFGFGVAFFFIASKINDWNDRAWKEKDH